MLADSWVISALGRERLERATDAVTRDAVLSALSVEDVQGDSRDLNFVTESVELAAFDLMDDADNSGLQDACEMAFRLLRASIKREPLDVNRVVRMSALGILAGKSPDVSRSLRSLSWRQSLHAGDNWLDLVRDSIYDAWLLLCRKDGWADLDNTLETISKLRRLQSVFESTYLENTTDRKRTAAWELIAYYHIARAVETIAQYTIDGNVDGTFDIDEQLDAQFDRSIVAASRAENIDLENIARLLHAASRQLATNSIWTSSRSVSSQVTEFVRSLVSRDNHRPFFELLPPQRKALTEQSLIGSSFRSIVLSLPTSSGKTLIAQFRILQALSQFEHEDGWVAYLAPTRALVGQITRTLRNRFAPLGIRVERVSPALEVDNMETELLMERESSRFRVLVTTPEKFDLLLRGGWEDAIARPLTLVVVDEAHNIGAEKRGITLELLLATINRECRNAQFLLLTPFIENAFDVARWLDRQSYRDISVGLDWRPNEVAIAIAQPTRAGGGRFGIQLKTVFTSHNTLAIPEVIDFPPTRQLGFTFGEVHNGQGKLAAATRQTIKAHGTAIVLTQTIPHTWNVARHFAVAENREAPTEAIGLAQRFLTHEFGERFDLVDLLSYRVGVHHSGLSDETKILMEDLLERGDIKTLVATTTIAQGVNFPVSAVIIASHQYPYGQDMPPADFWNLAGRVGRVDQDRLGFVIFAAGSDERAQTLEAFVDRSAGKLVSTLISMVRSAFELGEGLRLETLYRSPQWSHFLQYLAHTYRVMGDRHRFVTDVEQILRGTLGFHELRADHPEVARRLINQVQRYASTLAGQPLTFVDRTGFSLESVKSVLAVLHNERIDQDIWDPTALFSPNDRSLARLIGVMLKVPELHDQFDILIQGRNPTGGTIASILKQWVHGEPIPSIAAHFFGDDNADDTDAISRCCKELFGSIAGTAAWGLSALQTLTVGESLEGLAPHEQSRIRNIPAMVQYGVDTDDGVAMRLLGVPRTAARELTIAQPQPSSPSTLAGVRARLSSSRGEDWEAAMGPRGRDYYQVWRLVEGPIP